MIVTMIKDVILAYIGASALIGLSIPVSNADMNIVKMCLFYDRPSGHVRSDPIISQDCASDHVHTFYGPRDIHPKLTYEDLVATPTKYSTSPWVENQSLYWHPSIYQVEDNGDGTETFTRVSQLSTSPYYRWDPIANPEVEAFPPGFRMIAANTDEGANLGGEMGENMFTECCDLPDGREDCVSWNRLNFPQRSCAFLGIAFLMPTCWNGELGDENDHKNHMAFTKDGTVAGECPDGFERRLPQLQVFVRIMNYKGDKYRYQLSDGSVSDGTWHIDFFGGWKEGKLEEIIEDCPVTEPNNSGFNSACSCTEFLTPNKKVSTTMCDSDVRRLIVNEPTDVTNSLPRGTCQGPEIIEKTWEDLSSGLYECKKGGGSCLEYKKDKFYFNYEKKRNCKWLKKRKKKGKNWKKFCKRKTGTGGYDAGVVCPVTCENCD